MLKLLLVASSIIYTSTTTTNHHIEQSAGVTSEAAQGIQATYLAPFATNAPSEALFQRKDGLAALAPIIN
ncbi:hypothetical protein L917_06775, partial [Phytophthora nicotianae]